MRKGLFGLACALAVAAVMLVATVSVGAQGKPSYGCAPGFDWHGTTWDATDLPRSRMAIEDGLVASREELQAIYRARFDHNGNDMVCVKEVPGWFKEPPASKPFVEYLYNFVDDASSSSNGP